MIVVFEELPETFKFTCGVEGHKLEYFAVRHDDSHYHISWNDYAGNLGQCYEKDETILSYMNRTDNVKWRIID